jgi:superfamily I DNA and/or RNA helicase
MISLALKFDTFSENNIPNEVKDLINSKSYKVKILTNKKKIVYDYKDYRNIKSLDNVKMCYERSDGGIAILIGNLQNDFRQPMGGMFFFKKYAEEETEFQKLKGVPAAITFVFPGYSPTGIEEMQDALRKIEQSEDFEYNISQFDEFMDLFDYYKALSSELNNNESYRVLNISEPYYFIYSDVKDFDSDFKQEVFDENGVLKGYKISNTQFELLKNEIKDQVIRLLDVRIKGGAKELGKIKRIGDNNLYLSDLNFVKEADERKLTQFFLVNVVINKDEVILSGEMKNDVDYEKTYRFLNLYDMGQKIKIDSIENSIRLINQSGTSSATELLEYLIGDTEMPNKAMIRVGAPKYMKGLNKSQQEAFKMAIDGSPVSLIKGPPGTGKTHVINAITQFITKELKEKVIISSQTHIAIDNVLDKLMENSDIIIPYRITNRRNKYSEEYLDDTLYKTWGRNFLKHNELSSNNRLKKLMAESMSNFNGETRFRYSEGGKNEPYVIGATTTTTAIAGKKGLEVLKGYDWLIIDEVSKCPITEVIRYLPYVNKIILVGDDFQLAPLLEFSKEQVQDLPSYDEDKFEKLRAMYEQSVFAKVLNKAKASGRLVVLNENYRSLNQVLMCYNIFYNGELVGKREEVRPEKVHFSSKTYEDKDAIFVEVKGGQETTEGTSRFNVQEINATAEILKDLMKTAINPEKMTVSAIFPYAAQISHFQKNNIKLINDAKKLFKSFEIDTVDAFQGKESDVVLVNTVITDVSKRNFMNNFRRINVSMSRARDKLIIFGNSRTLKKIKMKDSDGKDRYYLDDIIKYISLSGKLIEYRNGELN